MRALRLTSPLAHGPDVRALQKALNAVHKDHPNVPKVGVDGQYGPATDHRTRQVAYLLGIGSKHIQGPVKPYVQRVIRNPKLRNPVQLIRARKRFQRFRKGLVGKQAFMDWAKSQVGTTETPYGSNRGPKVSKWQRDVAGIDGQPWCGAFAGYGLKHAAGLPIPAGVVYTPNIIGYAKTGTGGFASWHPYSERQEGDLLLFKFPGESSAPCDHVGICDGLDGSYDGNTSSDDRGSQSNGGIVAHKHRGGGYVVGCARPRWK